MAEKPVEPNNVIQLPPQLRNESPEFLEIIIVRQLPHADICPGCEEPVCCYIRAHILHLQARCKERNCVNCPRFQRWLQLHCWDCGQGDSCSIAACPIYKDQMKRQHKDRMQQIHAHIEPKLHDAIDHMTSDEFVERRSIINSFFTNFRQMIFLTGNMYLERRDWVRVSELGSGGFGSCYVVKDKGFQMPMALKEDNPNRYGMSEDEAFFALAIKRNQPIPHNLVEYFLVQPNPANPWQMQMFMELLQCPLSEHMQVTGPLQQDDVRFFCYQIFEGLDYLHSQRYIHRDIKPDNLLLDETHQRLKLADFGFAIQCTTHSTFHHRHAELPGTRHYNPPEIYGECISGTFTDVWQAAASTLYMCTGRRPNRHLYMEAEPRSGTFQRIANTMFHVLPSWLSQDVRELLSSSLHANYNTRCTAERAKELVRHSTAGLSTEELPLPPESPDFVPRPPTSHTLDLFVTSAINERHRQLFFCHHASPIEHIRECPFLICGWVTCFSDVSEDDTPSTLLEREDIIQTHPVIPHILSRLQNGSFCCLATALPPNEVARAVSNRQQDFTGNHLYTVLGLADRIGVHQAIVVMESVHS